MWATNRHVSIYYNLTGGMFIAGTREIANGALGYLQPHYKYIYAKELTILYTKIGKDYE